MVGLGAITYYCVQWQLVLHETLVACNTWEGGTYMYWKTVTAKVTHSHSHRKTSEFTKWKRKTIHVYSLTQFHLVVDIQGSPNISQKAILHQATQAGSSNYTLHWLSLKQQTALNKRDDQEAEVRKALLIWNDSYVFFLLLPLFFLPRKTWAFSNRNVLLKTSTHLQLLVLRDFSTSNSRLCLTGLIFSHPANRNEGFKAVVGILNKNGSMFSKFLPLKLPKV